MNIIYCINDYAGFNGAGATRALRLLIALNDELENYRIFCKEYILRDSEKNDDVIEATGSDVVNEFQKGGYLCIHWIRSNKYELFEEIVKEMKRRKICIPIVTTVCQKPSFLDAFLTPIEVRFSSVLIFIDKTSYNDRYFCFIPTNRKRMIRFGGYTEGSVRYFEKCLDSIKYDDNKKDCIIYGRGSSLNKCPKDMFEVFDKINPPKKVLIIGDGEDSWIKREIACRKDKYEIEIMPSLDYISWISQLALFDIFLYYLPPTAYSSTDGTMLDAMMLKKPVVYYGPDAPKEFLIDGFNSRIARSKDELAVICNELSLNVMERRRLGENARKTVQENMMRETTKLSYMQVYKTLAFVPPLEIPILFSMRYYYIICHAKFCVIYKKIKYYTKITLYQCYCRIREII